MSNTTFSKIVDTVRKHYCQCTEGWCVCPFTASQKKLMTDEVNFRLYIHLDAGGHQREYWKKAFGFGGL
jgi:hypothetical protein